MYIQIELLAASSGLDSLLKLASPKLTQCHSFRMSPTIPRFKQILSGASIDLYFQHLTLSTHRSIAGHSQRKQCLRSLPISSNGTRFKRLAGLLYEETKNITYQSLGLQTLQFMEQTMWDSELLHV